MKKKEIPKLSSIQERNEFFDDLVFNREWSVVFPNRGFFVIKYNSPDYEDFLEFHDRIIPTKSLKGKMICEMVEKIYDLYEVMWEETKAESEEESA